MDELRIEDDEREALAGLSSVPPPSKSQSYSQQLRGNSAPKRHHQVRNHSLDDSQIPPVLVYDSSDDEFFPYSSNHQRLDQTLCADGPSDDPRYQCQPLPEFIGSGGGAGIFKVPTRASVHPGRPPCLELRPHPLRETQVGKFLRNIACSETQLWAGQESGLRVCHFKDAYELGCGLGGRVLRGDEDAAPYQESANTSPIMCLMADHANRLVWSGHKDGKIRSWRADQPNNHHLDPTSPFKEALAWQAHRAPVLAITMTFHGDLWSGSEGGVIRIWPWESMEKSLSLKPEERYMAALLVERSFIDLRTQVTVNGVCSISSQDVKCLLYDKTRGKVWCAGSLSFSLWYEYDKT